MAQVELKEDGNIGWIMPEDAQPDLRDPAVVAALSDAVRSAIETPDLSVVVLGHASLGGLSSPDIASDVPVDPTTSEALNALCMLIETSPKPVVGLMRRRVDLDVLSVMLACHYRLADISTSFALTRWFGAATGHTQRLPHLIGASEAIDIFAGQPRDAVVAQQLGLVDGLARADLPKALAVFLDQHSDAGLPPRPTLQVTTGTADAARFYSEVHAARKQASEQHMVRLIECVEGALLLPFDIGRNFEEAAAQELFADTVATANAHMRQMQTLAWAGPKTAPRPSVCLIGVSDVSLDWLQTCVEHGVPAKLYAPNDEAQKRLSRAWSFRMRTVEDPVQPDAVLTQDRAAMGADIIINTQAYRSDPPPDGLAGLQTETNLFAFSTPFQNLETCAAAFADPDRVIALNLSKDRTLLEWATLETPSPSAANSVQAIAAHLNLSLLKVGPSGGFLATRLEDGLVYAIELLLDAGVAPVTIDEALVAHGWPTPPLMAYDRRGLQAIADRQAVFQSHLPSGSIAPGILAAMVKDGETGQRAKLGFYAHTDQVIESNPRFEGDTNPASAALLGSDDPQSVVDFVVGVLAHIGARSVGRGFVEYADAVDLAALANGIVPAVLGGPMAAAEKSGLSKLLDTQQQWAKHNQFIRPTTVLRNAVTDGVFPRLDQRAKA